MHDVTWCCIIDFELDQGSGGSSKKAEGELTASKRLLVKACKTYNGLIDIARYDALACNSIWINHCINIKITPALHVKENNISSVKEIKSKITKSKCKEEWRDSKRGCVVKAYEDGFEMEGVTGTLRFVKFSKKLPKLKDKELTEVIIMTLPEATPVYEATRLQEDLNKTLK